MKLSFHFCTNSLGASLICLVPSQAVFKFFRFAFPIELLYIINELPFFACLESLESSIASLARIQYKILWRGNGFTLALFKPYIIISNSNSFLILLLTFWRVVLLFKYLC